MEEERQRGITEIWIDGVIRETNYSKRLASQLIVDHAIIRGTIEENVQMARSQRAIMLAQANNQVANKLQINLQAMKVLANKLQAMKVLGNKLHRNKLQGNKLQGNKLQGNKLQGNQGSI